jgi:hypothetical protein
MTTLEAALEFASQGWPVLPVHSVSSDGRCSCGKPDCPAPGKHPATRQGYKDATTNRDLIKAWFSESARNVGIATGETFCALDIDDNTESAWVIADQLVGGIPYTLSAKTRRGFHFYFTVEEHRVPSFVLSTQPRIELIGYGKYVIVPPSQFKKWLNYTEPAPIPERILRLPPIGIRERHSKVSEIVRGVPEGRRNVSAAALAGKLLGCFPPKDWKIAWSLLEAWNQRNKPPLPRKELRRVFDKIAARELRKRTNSESKEELLARAVTIALEHSNLSQRQLARLLNISKSKLSRLINIPNTLNPPSGVIGTLKTKSPQLKRTFKRDCPTSWEVNDGL